MSILPTMFLEIIGAVNSEELCLQKCDRKIDRQKDKAKTNPKLGAHNILET